MLGARINIVQPQIRNLIAYLLPLPDKKKQNITAEIKRNKTSRLEGNDRHASYQKRFNKVLSFVVMGTSEGFLHLRTMSCMI